MHISFLNLALLLLGLLLSFGFVWLNAVVPGVGPVLAVSGLLAALVTLVRPRAGLYILVFSMLLSPSFSAGGKLGPRTIEVRLDDIFLLLIFMAWFAMATVRKSPLVGLKVPLVKPMLGYLTVAMVSSLLGLIDERLRSLPVFMYMLKYAQYFMLYYMTYHLIDDFNRSRPFLYAGLATAVIVLAAAYYMMSLGTAPYCPFDIDQGVSETATLGGYLLIVCGVLGGLVLYHDRPGLRLAAAAAIVLCVPPILATTSRSTYLATLAMLIAMITLGKGRRVPILLFGSLFVLFIGPTLYKDYLEQARARISYTFVATGEQQTVRLFGETMILEPSAATRVRKWQSIHELWLRKHPLIGYGVTGVGLVDAQIPLVIGEVGLVGFACWGAIMWGLLIRLWRIWQTAEVPLQRGMAFGFLCVYVGLLAQSIGVNTFIIIRMMEPFWFLAAIMMRLYSDTIGTSGFRENGASPASLRRSAA